MFVVLKKGGWDLFLFGGVVDVMHT